MTLEPGCQGNTHRPTIKRDSDVMTATMRQIPHRCTHLSEVLFPLERPVMMRHGNQRVEGKKDRKGGFRWGIVCSWGWRRTTEPTDLFVCTGRHVTV